MDLTSTHMSNQIKNVPASELETMRRNTTVVARRDSPPSYDSKRLEKRKYLYRAFDKGFVFSESPAPNQSGGRAP